MDIIYIAMALTLIGQVTVGHAFYFGQILFLIANCIYVFRDIVLERPRADKVKDIMFMAVTIAIILLEIFF